MAGFRKPQWLSAEAPPKLRVPNTNCVLLRRFSAKGDPRRLIAAPLLAGQLPGDFVGVENHVNVIYGAERDMSPGDAIGLATLWNSRLYERFFRTISGNTQVSASEIRGTRFPSRDRIRAAAHRHRAPVASVLHDVPFRCQDRMVACKRSNVADPNFANRTLWTGDNLDILRGMNSASVDLIYLDPPFNSNKDYVAPVGSKAAGAAFKDTWTLSDLDVAWMGLIADEQPAIAHLLEDGGPDALQGDAVVPVHDGGAAAGVAPRDEGHGQHLPPLRPDRGFVPTGADGRGVRPGELPQRDHLGRIGAGRRSRTTSNACTT